MNINCVWFSLISLIFLIGKSRQQVINQFRLEITGGSSPEAGFVNLVHQDGTGSLLCAEKWTANEANVVCRQLGARSATTTEDPARLTHSLAFSSLVSGRTFIWFDVTCSGSEFSLSGCTTNVGQPVASCDFDHIVTVACQPNIAVVHDVRQQFLPDLMPDLHVIQSSVYVQDAPLYGLLCALEENCLSASAHAQVSAGLTPSSVRRLLRFSTRVYNFGRSDFLSHIPKHQWEWHQCHMHYHSMEVFSHYDIFDLWTNQRVAQGHKASFCLEDSDCLNGYPKRYACANFGDQGISPGCYDQYLHDIDCQWIDITDLPVGNYTFKVTINPEYRIAESDFNNNAVICHLSYGRFPTSLILSMCQYSSP